MLRLSRYERRDRKSAISLQRGPVDPIFHVEGVAPTNHSSSPKTRLNDLSYDVKIWTDLSSILSQSTRVTDRQTDGRTDRILIARPRLHSMQRGKNGSQWVVSDCRTPQSDDERICMQTRIRAETTKSKMMTTPSCET